MSFAAAAATTVDFSSFHLSHSSSSFYLCHSHLGHVLSSHLIFLASIRALRNLKTDISNYSGCKLVKFFALPFNWSIYVSSSLFDFIHFGPSPVATKEGSQCYVLFIDDHTCYCWVYLMKNHSKFFEIHAAFQSLVKTQHSAIIKCFRCDLGGEYTSKKFCQLLALNGTIHQISCIDTPEQNRVAERKHRHIIKTTRSLLLFAYVLSEFWGRNCPYCFKFD